MNRLVLLYVSFCCASPPTTAPQLRALRSLAVIRDSLTNAKGKPTRSLRLISPTSSLQSDLQALLTDLDAVAAPTPNQQSSQDFSPHHLRSLQKRAFLLDQDIAARSLKLRILDEQQSQTRVREVFNLVDANKDGVLQREEFKRAARCLIEDEEEDSDEGEDSYDNRGEVDRGLDRLFDQADVNQNGELDFEEFMQLLSSLKEKEHGRLLLEQHSAVSTFCEYLLEATSLSLITHFDTGSVQEYSAFVEPWCALERRIAATKGPNHIGALTDDTKNINQVREELKELKGAADEAKALAAALSQYGSSPRLKLRRAARKAAKASLKSLRFCFKGLRITFKDACQSVWLLRKPVFKREPLSDKDAEFVKRAIQEFIGLIPYTIIFIIPMSPPGHILAFNLYARFFPNAVPSGFTRQRQDMDQMFDEMLRVAGDGRKEAQLKRSA